MQTRSRSKPRIEIPVPKRVIPNVFSASPAECSPNIPEKNTNLRTRSQSKMVSMQTAVVIKKLQAPTKHVNSSPKNWSSSNKESISSGTKNRTRLQTKLNSNSTARASPIIVDMDVKLQSQIQNVNISAYAQKSNEASSSISNSFGTQVRTKAQSNIIDMDVQLVGDASNEAKLNKKVTSQREKPRRATKTAIAPVKKVFKVGELCFGKIRGYCEWPALITEVQKNYVLVKFFNSTQSGKCFFGKVYDLEESVRFLGLHEKNQQLQKAKIELAIVLREKLRQESLPLKSHVISKYLSLI